MFEIGNIDLTIRLLLQSAKRSRPSVPDYSLIVRLIESRWIMSRPWKALLLIALLGIVYSGHAAKAASSVDPVFSSEAEKIFGQGLGHYRNGQFNKARQVFDKLSVARLHQYSSASFFMVAKTLFNLGEYAEVLKTAKEFSGSFSHFELVNTLLGPHSTLNLTRGSSHFKFRFLASSM